MTQNWQPTTTTSGMSTTSSQQRAGQGDKGVILVYGVNIFGDKIYSYVETSIDRLKQVKDMLDRGESFKPSDIGNVLAAGRGEPAEDIREEMYEKYGITHVAPPWNAPKDPANPVFSPPPKYTFDDEEDDE